MSETPNTSLGATESRLAFLHYLEHLRIVFCIVARYTKYLRRVLEQCMIEKIGRTSNTYLLFNAKLVQALENAEMSHVSFAYRSPRRAGRGEQELRAHLGCSEHRDDCHAR